MILGAAGAVTIAYAIARFFIREESSKNPHDVPNEQAVYMRQVRERSKAWAWEDAFGGNGGARNGGSGGGGKGRGSQGGLM